jgi:hypothetical protein
MSAAIRFLGVIVVAWVGMRTVSLGLIPGAEALTSIPSFIPGFTPAPEIAYDPPLLAPAEAPMFSVPAPAQAELVAAASPAPPPPTPAIDAAQARLVVVSAPAPVWFTPLPKLDDWPLSRIASSSQSQSHRQSTPVRTTPAPAPIQPRLDRISLTTWSLLRNMPAGTPLPEDSLASGGTLGGSQAGARLAFAFNRALAASLRLTSNIGGENGAEVALGMRWTPLRSVPASITFERRQRIGNAGRSAFALFAEGGVYERPVPFKFTLDAYAQAGVVGFKHSDYFADGAMTFTRPVWRRFSAGVGVWGGVQPGVYRVDAGPRVSLRVGRSMRVHFDYRQRLAGEAFPGSGPAVTIAGDF